MPYSIVVVTFASQCLLPPPGNEAQKHVKCKVELAECLSLKYLGAGTPVFQQVPRQSANGLCGLPRAAQPHANPIAGDDQSFSFSVDFHPSLHVVYVLIAVCVLMINESAAQAHAHSWLELIIALELLLTRWLINDRGVSSSLSF